MIVLLTSLTFLHILSFDLSKYVIINKFVCYQDVGKHLLHAKPERSLALNMDKLISQMEKNTIPATDNKVK